jgi:hypothetical protein
MAFQHYDIGNFEASVMRYLGDSLLISVGTPYEILYDESATNFETKTKWFFIEFLGHEGEQITKAPVRHILVHIRTRGESADSDMTTMTRVVVDALRDKIFSLYDTDDDEIVGKLRCVILREFPKEPIAQQASRGFNRSVLLRVSYGKKGVAYV